MEQKFVYTSGRNFLKTGEKISFNGIGLGSWLNMEHFMMGIPGTDKQIRRTFEMVYGKEVAESFFDDFTYDFIGEEDFKFLKEYDINLVRVPINYRLFIDDKTGERKEKGYEYLRYLLDLGSKFQIYILPDLHTTPGGQNPDWHSDNGTGYTEFWEYYSFRKEICELWKDIATELKDEEYLLGYDILNEPFIVPELIEASQSSEDMATGLSVDSAKGELCDFTRQVIAAIREADKRHIIFIEGDHFASDFEAFNDIEDEQLAMEFHFYPTVWYPDLYSDSYSRSERYDIFEKVLCKLIDAAGKSGHPVLCGEAGYEIKTNGFDRTLPLIEDTIALFKKHDVSFTLWSYKDAGFMGMAYPKKDTLWMKLSRDAQERWDHHSELGEAERLTDELCDKLYPEAKKEERYVLTFRLRALMYPLEEKYVLAPLLVKYGKESLKELAESFAFRNCDFYKEFAELFKMR